MTYKSCYICDKEKYNNNFVFKTNEKQPKETCECKWCGNYTITEDVKEYLKNLPSEERKKYKIQFYTREQNDKFGIKPFELTAKKVQSILNLPDKTITEQFNLLLLNLFEKHPRYIKSLTKQELELIRIRSCIKNYYDLRKLFEKAYSEDFLERDVDSFSILIKILKALFSFQQKNTLSLIIHYKDFTFKGIEYIESLKEKNTNSKKVFLAYKFEDNIRDSFNELSDDIHSKLEYEPIVVNQSITSHDEKIGDKIIGELKSCRFLIADLSHHSNNVYYEIGYAMGMGIPVILTCKKEFMDKLAFDISQYPVFEWSNENELKEKVIDRIKAIL